MEGRCGDSAPLCAPETILDTLVYLIIIIIIIIILRYFSLSYHLRIDFFFFLTQ